MPPRLPSHHLCLSASQGLPITSQPNPSPTFLLETLFRTPQKTGLHGGGIGGGKGKEAVIPLSLKKTSWKEKERRRKEDEGSHSRKSNIDMCFSKPERHIAWDLGDGKRTKARPYSGEVFRAEVTGCCCSNPLQTPRRDHAVSRDSSLTSDRYQKIGK